MNIRRTSGFSIIELVVTVTVLGVLTALALPSFGRWIANTQVRGMAESIQNGSVSYTHLIYGRHINVRFLHKLRSEMKFSGLEALKAQIALDVINAESYFTAKAQSRKGRKESAG